MKYKSLLKATVAVFGITGALQAFAVPIVGLYNTGVGTAVAGGADANYSLVKTSGAGAGLLTAYQGTGINGNWLANDATSQWLTPASNGNQTFDASSNGVYEYSLSFDLTGMNAATATFTGRWATDNAGKIFLNGTQLNNNSNGFNSWSSFSSAGGSFISGINTLTFEVTNFAQTRGNPTGLHVEFTGSNVEVPEPSALAVLSIGLIGLGISRRRKSW